MNNPPTGIDEAAPVIARQALPIRAPAAVVWTLLTDVPAWPSWQPDVMSAQAPTPLAPGVTFHWRTAGADIASTVYVFDAPQRILWGGTSQDITAVHQWTLAPASTQTLVATQQSWDGARVRADPASIQQALDQSLDQWLGHLKSAAERRHRAAWTQ